MAHTFTFNNPYTPYSPQANLIGPPATPDETVREEPSRMVQDGIERLHRIGKIMFILTILLAIAFILGFVGMLMLTFTAWFSTWEGYRMFLPTLMAALILPFINFAWSRNLGVGIYTFYTVVVGIWTVFMLVVVIWGFVDLFSTCPGPAFCTDPVTLGLATGWIIYFASVVIELIVYIVSLVLFQVCKRAALKMQNSFGTGITTAQLDQMVADALSGKSARYIKGISMRYVE